MFEGGFDRPAVAIDVASVAGVDLNRGQILVLGSHQAHPFGQFGEKPLVVGHLVSGGLYIRTSSQRQYGTACNPNPNAHRDIPHMNLLCS